MKLAFSKVQLLDASRASITSDHFDILDILRQDLGKKVVDIKDEGIEHSFSGDRAS